MPSRTLHPFALALPIAGLLALAACAPAERDAAAPTSAPENLALGEAAEQAAQAITPEALRGPIERLAADEMEGRGPGTRGDEMARRYLAAQLEEIGFAPGAADGSWEQPFDIVGLTAKVPDTWTFRAGPERLSFKLRDEFIAFSGVQQPTAAVDDAELVFVGYGIEAPEYDWNDFKGMDLTGKVLVMLNNDPDWDPQLFEGDRRLFYGRWTYKYQSAAAQGAAGAIIIHTTPSAGYPWQVVETSWTGPQFELPAGDEPRIQVGGWVTEDAAKRLMALGGHQLDRLVESARSRDFAPVPLGIQTSLAITIEVERTRTANVLGLLRGSDPDLAEQVVVYSAHHDHLGMNSEAAEGEDAIYNGALDNAAGVSQVLAIGRAFRALPRPPRRSLLIAFVAAEEQGLLGSKYYAEHPTFSPGKIAANVNYDGGNIWGRTRDITYIGYGKSSLDEVVERFAEAQGRSVKPDQFPDRGFFYRSDQFNFAKIGVPAIYLDNGTEVVGQPEGWGRERIEEWEAVHYHQPSDELNDEWTFDGMVEDARLGFYAGLYIAEEPSLPRWNPGDEFEAARQQALSAAAEGGGE